MQGKKPDRKYRIYNDNYYTYLVFNFIDVSSNCCKKLFPSNSQGLQNQDAFIIIMSFMR